MNLTIKTNINVLPFGTTNHRSTGPSLLRPEQSRERPNYGVPLTTDIESLKFDLFDETLPIPADSEGSLE